MIWSLPARCLLCLTWGRQSVCGACLALHVGHGTLGTRPRCTGCGLRLAPGVSRCAVCERAPPAHGAVRVAVDYAHPWDRIVVQLKFGARPDWGAGLALLMGRALENACTESLPTRLVPVPLSPERLRLRGYNQAWELARPLARRMGLAARADVLMRPVHLAGQAEQDREARLNRLRGVFQVSHTGRSWLMGQRVALVDDVLTTGATAAEAARTLMAAGATEVEVWAVAKTPPPEEGPS